MNKPRISIIAALSDNNVIGVNNSLPWHIPGDLKRFKELTTGHPIIMGRKTFESLGRILPLRTNIVVTRDSASFLEKATYHPDAVVSSLEKAVEVARLSPGGDEEIFIIGGGHIFKEALEKGIVHRLYLTLVHAEIDGDVFFPDYSDFTKVISRDDAQQENLSYTYLTLGR